MKNKFIIRLLLLVAVSISLYSCVHDEISSSSDPSSKEYQSKSLWKEDVKYIKNVMKIYQENETKIKTTSGIPLWEYAMTIGKMDESFLIVPIKEGDKIISVLSVPRIEDKVYFNYSDKAEYVNFFQKYIDAPIKKVLNTETASSVSRYSCTTQTVSMWYPNNESNPDSGGHWGSVQITNCVPVKELSGCYRDVFGNCVNDGGGYPYPGDGGGGSGPQDPEEPEDPCAKTKSNLTNPQVKANIDDLKTKTTGTVENAYKFKADGTPSNLIVGGKHNVKFGDKTGYEGGYHNHTTGTPMFSPADIEQLLQFALAQPTSNPANASNAYLGMVAPNGIHYVIQFNGNYDGALVTFSQDQLNGFADNYKDTKDVMTLDSQYSTDHLNLNNNGLEKLFFDTLKNMGLDGKVNLQRIENGGVIKNIQLDSANQPVPVTCP